MCRKEDRRDTPTPHLSLSSLQVKHESLKGFLGQKVPETAVKKRNFPSFLKHIFCAFLAENAKSCENMQTDIKSTIA